MERRQILNLLASPQSAAEISARLRLPLGVARVVVGDLVDEGFVALNTRSATGRPDLRLLERVLDGLQAL
jgi:DNA-binding IclR family transcriptional regulator